MVRRTNVLVLAGIACFVLGVAIVLLLGGDDGGSDRATASGDSVNVLVATQDVPPGTTGEALQDLVEVRRVSVQDRLSDAVASPMDLSNTIVTATFKKDEQIRTAGLKTRNALGATIELPPGKEAVSVTLPYVNGGAGYIAAGDKVNVYQVIPDVVKAVNEAGTEVAAGLPFSTPHSELLLTGVRVLDVQYANGSIAQLTTNGGNDGPRPNEAGQVITVLLAVDTIDAEKVIFGSTAQSLTLYLTRLNEDAPPSGPTEGRDYPSQFAEEANEAFARSNP